MSYCEHPACKCNTIGSETCCSDSCAKASPSENRCSCGHQSCDAPQQYEKESSHDREENRY